MTSSHSPLSPKITQKLWNLLFRLISSDWALLALKVWQLIQHIHTEQAVGLYEVLAFEHHLELCDAQGRKAIYRKRATVKFLQDFVTAYEDQVWGLGDVFADYQCSPGIPVDRYRDGHKYRVLISLREVKRRGERMKINIERTVNNGFGRSPGWSETEISHRTRQMHLSVTFPKARPPKQAFLIQHNAGRTQRLGPENIEMLPDGRRRIFWHRQKPTLFEKYSLKWTW